MPTDKFLVRFCSDDEGRQTIAQQIVESSRHPWPPHRHAVMAVATDSTADEMQHFTLAAVISPDSSATLEGYTEFLESVGPDLDLARQAFYPQTDTLHLMWFTRTTTSQMDDDMASADHIIRGCVYRPSTHAELIDWLGEEAAAKAFEGQIEFPDPVFVNGAGEEIQHG